MGKLLNIGMIGLFMMSCGGAALAQDLADIMPSNDIAITEDALSTEELVPLEEILQMEEVLSIEDAAPAAEIAPVEDAVPTIADKSDDRTPARSSNPAARFPHGLQLGAGASFTSGLGGFVGYANKNFDSFWWKRFGVRLDFATIAPLKSSINSALNSAIDDGLEIETLTIDKLNLSAHHYGALVDFYPFGNTWFLGGLRLSGGYVFGKTALTANLSGSSDNPMEFELNGVEYRYNGGDVHGTAKLDWNYRGPYLGAGFDLGLVLGVKIYMDVGAVFSNRTPAIDLQVPINGYLETWDGSNWQSVQGNSSLEAEFNDAKNIAFADADNELGKIKVYPMVKLGIMYRF